MSEFLVRQNAALLYMQFGSWRRVDTVVSVIAGDAWSESELVAVFEKNETAASPGRVAVPMIPPLRWHRVEALP